MQQDFSATALKLLKSFYGHDSFRSMQRDIINCVCNGNDALVLMPTGGGKSVCFQIPALILDGCALVVSPLVALMRDQVDTLVANGIPAAAVNSTQSDAVNRTNIERAQKGKLRLLYISPERLISDMDSWIADVKVSLIAIDEAHCISQWGHDFRPEYTRLSEVRQRMNNVPMMALTATADKVTRDDIISQLNLQNAQSFITSFDRPNLSLNVISGYDKKAKVSAIRKFIDSRNGSSGIVYCLSRANTESLCKTLCSLGYHAVCYHAGLSVEERERAQAQFLNDDVNIICATVAFGMGIDKSNIRWVIHYNMPKNMESYYQEIGRAGRDGLASDTLMFYSYGDVVRLRNFVNEGANIEVTSEKLLRMQQYAESNVCRRRILLSYFGEEYSHNCGNCDVCRHPPVRIDATIIAQKALSAMARTGYNVGFTLLIDILRGSSRVEIIEKGYNKIKTYGIGADMPYKVWQYYLLQMMQLGVFEIDYKDSNKLKITPLGSRILLGKEQLEMSQYHEVENTASAKLKQAKYKPTPTEKLFDDLTVIRAQLAAEANVMPYILFSDASLKEMVDKTPTDIFQFSQISGVSEIKVLNYWKPFVSVLRKYKGVKSVAGDSECITLYMLQNGASVNEIAEQRKISLITVGNHIASLYVKGHIEDISHYVSSENIEEVAATMRSLKIPTARNVAMALKSSDIDTWRISIAVAIIECMKSK